MGLVSPGGGGSAELLAGYCSEHLLVIANEASGIPDMVFAPLDGILSGFDSKVLLLGRMNRDSGYFFNSHFKKGIMDKWTKLNWTVELK